MDATNQNNDQINEGFGTIGQLDSESHSGMQICQNFFRFRFPRFYFLEFLREVTFRIRDKNVKVWFNSRVLKSKGRFKYNIDTESFTTQINVHYTEHSDGQTGRIEKSYSNFRSSMCV